MRCDSSERERALLAATISRYLHPTHLGRRVALRFNAAEIADVRRAAQETAADGAALAKAAGFNARGAEIEFGPTWKGIVHAAEEHDASLIVLGSHGRTGLAGVLLGSVAEAVAAHSRRSVLIVHRSG